MGNFCSRSPHRACSHVCITVKWLTLVNPPPSRFFQQAFLPKYLYDYTHVLLSFTENSNYDKGVDEPNMTCMEYKLRIIVENLMSQKLAESECIPNFYFIENFTCRQVLARIGTLWKSFPGENPLKNHKPLERKRLGKKHL